MNPLERAIAIAVAAHTGQQDKAGQSYILHPLRVMLAMASDDERIVAVLHDVVEDCPTWSFEQLRAEGFSDVVIDALRSVTKISDAEDYDHFIDRAMANVIGRRVKLADLRDNADLSRLPAPTDRDLARVDKYRRAIVRIETANP
jgi:(p)ppGpp synthase/HD superfamily hydrolase